LARSFLVLAGYLFLFRSLSLEDDLSWQAKQTQWPR